MIRLRGVIQMNQEINEIKKRVIHQIADDFYTRFESNEQKLQRLRKLQAGESPLPEGLDVEGDIKIPDVADMHSMLLNGVQGDLETPVLKKPEEECSLKKIERN